MNDHISTALVAVSSDPGQRQSEDFGHFMNATLLNKTRSFIIATLTLTVHSMKTTIYYMRKLL